MKYVINNKRNTLPNGKCRKLRHPLISKQKTCNHPMVDWLVTYETYASLSFLFPFQVHRNTSAFANIKQYSWNSNESNKYKQTVFLGFVVEHVYLNVISNFFNTVNNAFGMVIFTGFLKYLNKLSLVSLYNKARDILIVQTK